MLILIVCLILVICNIININANPTVGHDVAGNYGQASSTKHILHGVSNKTLAGTDFGCMFSTKYDTTSITNFKMCTGQTNQQLKNGMSIINLIGSRGYLPTCRVMQLMLWMASEVQDIKYLPKETFVDVGANIGSCTVHMASLGLPVISVDPVQEHVDTIRGSMEINPSFHIDLQHVGISAIDKHIRANFGHGARNWGATEFHEVEDVNATAEMELRLKTVDQVVGNRRVSLIKIDCEGCEWAAIKGAKRVLRRTPMIKIELVQNDYQDRNETVTAQDILIYLEKNGFDLFIDHWAENHLYFGKRGNEILDIDRLFGSPKFKLETDHGLLIHSGEQILKSKIDPHSWNQREFLKSATDVIAIEKGLAEKMRKRFNVPSFQPPV
jgi:FkbM family methyltransferase